MGETSDRVLGACLRVVRAATALAVLALVGATAYLIVAPASGGPKAKPLAVPKAAPAPRTRTPSAVESAPPPTLEANGRTPLVRRLEIGAELNLLRGAVERDGAVAARFEERYRRIAPFLLTADRAPSDWPDDPQSVLRQLTEPRRDLGRLVLAGARADDPLGASLRVRTWTLGEPYPEGELALVTGTIDHIVRRTGRDVDGGIDVLVTPGMGHDVFPLQRELPWAVGVYFPDDRYCVVRSGLPSGYRPEVVEHECIHALCRAIPSFSTSRLVTEGLAEYLRFLHAADPGLHVPRERFLHQLARLALLVERLEAHGVDLRAIDPRRLVDLSPQDFYALRHFSYLVAQLTLAHIGGDVVEKAFAEGSDHAIVAAVRALSWSDFLAFVREGAKGGNPVEAMVVEDVAEEVAPRRDGAAFAAALRAIGAGLERNDVDPALVAWGDAGELGTVERIVAVLRALDARERVAIVTCTFPDDPRCEVPPVPEAISIELLGAPTGASPAQVALSLRDLLRKRHPKNLVATGAERLRPDALRSVLERDAVPGLVIVGTDCTPALAGLDLAGDPRFVNVLVVDLSEGGEAVDLARLHDVKGTLVAYWRLRLREE